MTSVRYRSLLVLIDVVLINLAFALGYVLRYQLKLLLDTSFSASFSQYWQIQLIYTVGMLAMFWLDGVYAPRRAPSWFDQMLGILSATVKSIFIVWLFMFLNNSLVYSRLMMIWVGLATLVLLGALRWTIGMLKAARRQRGIGVASVLIVGAGELGRSVMRTIVARPELGYVCAGFVDDDDVRGQTDIGRFRALGHVDSVDVLLANGTVPIDEVIVTLPWAAQRKILDVVNVCNHFGKRVRVVPSLLQINLSRVDVDDLGGIPLLSVRQPTVSPVNQIIKRAFDLAVGIPAFSILLPVMAVAAVLIRLDTPGSPLFSQPRAGKGGKSFRLFKLRSMVQNAEQEKAKLMELNEADGPMFKIKNDPRMTRIGRVIRKLSIDEMPQFWHVIVGEMSIVGPRPALMEEVEQYNEWQRERLRVKPGITGLWQISGRSELTFDEMCLLDVYYIENWSLTLDLKIALKTVPYLLSAKGAY